MQSSRSCLSSPSHKTWMTNLWNIPYWGICKKPQYAAHFPAIRPEPIHLSDGCRRDVPPLGAERSLDSFVCVFPLRHDWSPPEGLCLMPCSVPRLLSYTTLTVSGFLLQISALRASVRYPPL
jgi:hypothetical protein